MKTEKEDHVLEPIVHREMDVIAVITEVVTTDKIKKVTDLVTTKMAMANAHIMEANVVLTMVVIVVMMVKIVAVISRATMADKVVSATTNSTVTQKVAVIIQTTNIAKRNKSSIKNSLLTIRNLCV